MRSSESLWATNQRDKRSSPCSHQSLEVTQADSQALEGVPGAPVLLHDVPGGGFGPAGGKDRLKVDGPFADIRDPDTYREECRRAMTLGLVGKWAIHPSQVEIAQEIFSPTPTDVDRARAMKAAFDEALAKGLGAVMYEGKMIDIASIRIINNVVERANLIGM